MDKDSIEMKIYIKPWHNLVEEVIENTIGDILSQVVKNGEYRLMPYGDSNEFYNEESLKKKILDTEIYSLPLTKCHYDIIFNLINSIIKNTTSRKKTNNDNLIVVFKGCKVNGTNIDINIGIGLIEE